MSNLVTTFTSPERTRSGQPKIMKSHSSTQSITEPLEHTERARQHSADNAENKSPSSLAQLCAAWIENQCRNTGAISSAFATLLSAESGDAIKLSWPHSIATSSEVELTAASVEKEQRVVVRRVTRKTTDTSTGEAAKSIHIGLPLNRGSDRIGTAVFVTHDQSDGSTHALAKRLYQSSDWIDELAGPITSRSPTENSASTTSPDLRFVFERFCTLLEQDHWETALTAFMTELASHFDCDRASLGFAQRGQIRLAVVSSTVELDRKTNAARAIERCMDECYHQSAIIKYPASAAASGSEFRLTRAHDELARELKAAAIYSLPIVAHGEVIGVATFEHRGADGLSDRAISLCDLVLGMAAPYLRLRLREQRPWSIRAADAAADLKSRFASKGHRGWKIGAACAVLGSLFLFFAHGDFRVTSPGILEGSVQRSLVAPFDGFVRSSEIRAGEVIAQGTTLCTLDDRDLTLEESKWRSEKEQIDKQYQQALAEHDAVGLKMLAARSRQAEAQLNLIRDHIRKTRVVAPFDGVVVRGDLSQSIGAPVARGDVLYQIAPLDGYRVSLLVDERDIAHVSESQHGRLVLPAFPGESLPFVVTNVTPVSTTEEGRNHFRVEAKLTERPSIRLRPGMEGVAKIEVGSRNLFYIWTRGAIEWLQLWSWKWLP